MPHLSLVSANSAHNKAAVAAVADKIVAADETVIGAADVAVAVKIASSKRKVEIAAKIEDHSKRKAAAVKNFHPMLKAPATEQMAAIPADVEEDAAVEVVDVAAARVADPAAAAARQASVLTRLFPRGISRALLGIISRQ